MAAKRKRSRRRPNGDAPRFAPVILVLSRRRVNELSIFRGSVGLETLGGESKGGGQRKDDDDLEASALDMSMSPICSQSSQ